MAKVTGFGGVFMKTADKKKLFAFYRDALGIDAKEWGAKLFHEEGGPRPFVLLTPFAADTKYFEPSTREFMVNLRVDDLDGVLARARTAGANVLDRREEGEQGRFGYVVDPEGTLIELWEPPATNPASP